MSSAVNGEPSCQVTPWRKLKTTFIRPSGSIVIPPFSSEGTVSASRPTGLRLPVSDVTRPSVCISVRAIQPPVGVPVATARLMAGTLLVMPTVRDFVLAGASAPPDGDGTTDEDGPVQAATISAMRPSQRAVAGLGMLGLEGVGAIGPLSP